VKLFECDNCRQTLFFESSSCVNCGAALGFVPETAALVTLRVSAPDGERVFEALSGGESQRHRQCRNAREHDACNWLVPDVGGAEYCRSCALSEVIPDLSDPYNEQAWLRIEAAKRRLLYTLFALKLPVTGRGAGEHGLAFRFMKATEASPVMTGHEDGVITLNIDEADFAFRENMREKMGEGYRTVLGHLRHEIGHYYWDLLVRDDARVDEFRGLFGDERRSYEEALAQHYTAGPPPGWSDSFISAYATMHPWEDWAETWAHYLHMVDTLETAKSHGLTVRVPATEQPGERVATERLAFFDFDALATGWNAVTLALNSLNRSMGMKDAYPFVLTASVLAKLRFVHEIIIAQADSKAGPELRSAA
jgi:hypothetical protein